MTSNNRHLLSNTKNLRGIAGVVFDLDNSEEQPRKGVYRWYATAGGKEIATLYVGSAGGKKTKPPRKPSTLAKGGAEDR